MSKQIHDKLLRKIYIWWGGGDVIFKYNTIEEVTDYEQGAKSKDKEVK